MPLLAPLRAAADRPAHPLPPPSLPLRIFVVGPLIGAVLSVPFFYFLSQPWWVPAPLPAAAAPSQLPPRSMHTVKPACNSPPSVPDLAFSSARGILVAVRGCCALQPCGCKQPLLPSCTTPLPAGWLAGWLLQPFQSKKSTIGPVRLTDKEREIVHQLLCCRREAKRDAKGRILVSKAEEGQLKIESNV